MLSERDALFLRLFKSYRRAAYGVIWRVLRGKLPHDVEDVLQITFIKCHRAFNPELVGSFPHWFLEASKRNAIDQLRKGVIRTRHPVALVELESQPELAHPDGDARAQSIARESRRLLLEAIAALDNEKHRKICLLRLVNGLGYAQVAETLGIPVGTVMSALHRARPLVEAHLRARLEAPALPSPTPKAA